MWQMNWSVVSAVSGEICDIRCLFTATDVALDGCTRTTESCQMNGGLVPACYYDNNYQVQ